MRVWPFKVRASFGTTASRRANKGSSAWLKKGLALVMTALLVGSMALTAHGSHTVITSSDVTYNPSSWNGYKVYLSSPRHSDSGGRGECGWEENINGRHWNIYAASTTSGGQGGLKNRGYKVTVSANARDNGWATNRQSSNNWGADVHIVTHTNATGSGCGEPAQYLLVMYRSGDNNSIGFKNDLITTLNPAVPGGSNSWDCDHLGECNNNLLAAHRAYVELFFHTSQSAVSNWFQAGGGVGDGIDSAWRLGYGVDLHLGYP